MTEHGAEIIPYLLAAIGVLLSWIMQGISRKMSDLSTGLKAVNETMGAIERDLRGGMAALDRRVTKIETRCELKHGQAQD